MALLGAFLCTTEKASYLSPSRGHSQLSPLTVVRVARHCSRVLRQARTLSRLSNNVEPCFPHWCTLPHPAAPLLLSAGQTTATATVQSVHLPYEKKGGTDEFIMCICLFLSVCGMIYMRDSNDMQVCFSVCVHSP